MLHVSLDFDWNLLVSSQIHHSYLQSWDRKLFSVKFSMFALWFIMMILLRIFFSQWKVFTSRQFCHHLLTLKLFQIGMNFFLLNTKEDILKKKKIFWWMCKSKTWSDPCWLLFPVDFTIDIVFFSSSPYYGSEQLPAIVWLHEFFKISSFVFIRKEKKKTHTVWNVMRRVNDDRISIFRWTIPLRLHIRLQKNTC